MLSPFDFSSTNNTPPIVIEFAGGLGNQFFQYAFAQYLRRHIDRTILFDASAVYRDIKRDLLIQKFNVDSRFIISSRKKIFSILGTRILTSLSTFEKIMHRIRPYQNPEDANTITLIDDDILSKGFLYKQSHLSEQDINDYAKVIIKKIQASSEKPVYIRGYWQYNFFSQDNAQTEKTFPPQYLGDISDSAMLLLRTLQEQQHSSCSLHIRRGDYLEESVANILPPLNSEYYKKAIAHILSIEPSTKFYIFSDDKDWCQEHFSALYSDILEKSQLSIVSGELSKNTVEDIILMNNCTHHILANSSFSWWGTMNPDLIAKSKNNVRKALNNRVFIAPKKWFTDPIKNELICNSSWLRF